MSSYTMVYLCVCGCVVVVSQLCVWLCVFVVRIGVLLYGILQRSLRTTGESHHIKYVDTVRGFLLGGVVFVVDFSCGVVWWGCIVVVAGCLGCSYGFFGCC